MGYWSCLFIYYWHLQGSRSWRSLCQGWLQSVQAPVKGQIPALHPAKECVEEAMAEKRLLQLLLLQSKVCMGCRSSILLNPLLSEDRGNPQSKSISLMHTPILKMPGQFHGWIDWFRKFSYYIEIFWVQGAQHICKGWLAALGLTRQEPIHNTQARQATESSQAQQRIQIAAESMVMRQVWSQTTGQIQVDPQQQGISRARAEVSLCTGVWISGIHGQESAWPNCTSPQSCSIAQTRAWWPSLSLNRIPGWAVGGGEAGEDSEEPLVQSGPHTSVEAAAYGLWWHFCQQCHWPPQYMKRIHEELADRGSQMDGDVQCISLGRHECGVQQPEGWQWNCWEHWLTGRWILFNFIPFIVVLSVLIFPGLFRFVLCTESSQQSGTEFLREVPVCSLTTAPTHTSSLPSCSSARENVCEIYCGGPGQRRKAIPEAFREWGHGK